MEVQLELPFNSERSRFQSIACKLRFVALAKSGYAGGTGRGNIDQDRIEIVLQTRSLSLIPITVEHASLGWVESKCASAIERSDQLVLKGNAGRTHSLPGAGWKGSVRFRIITAIINITSSKRDRHAELQQVVIAIYVV